MITLLAQSVNLLAFSFQKCLCFTSYIGQLIVLLISSVTTILFNTIVNIFIFFRIVYEDNVSIFTEDIPEVAANLLDYMSKQGHCVLDICLSACMELNYKYNVFIGAVKWSLESMLFVFCEVLFLWKKTIILVGESVWLVLTFIPVHLPYLFKVVFKYICDCIVENVVDLYMSLLNFTNFISDVPFESFVGILSAMIIIRLCIYFRETVQSQVVNVYWIFIRKLLYLYYTIYNYFMDSEVRMIAQLVDSQQVAARDASLGFVDANDTEDSNDSLCIICQERQKCVLTLPCRHICLCTECCVRLYGYQRTCPICRRFIYHSVTVYL